MNNPENSQRLAELAEAARATPVPPTISEHLLAVLTGLLAGIEDIRALLSRKVKDYYTVEEVAEMAGRSAYTIRRWIKEERIKATRVEGTGPKGRLLVARPELAKLVDEGKAGGLDEVSLGERAAPATALPRLGS